METANRSKSARIRRKIREWSEANPRPMPWRSIKNPYLIWLSEIILQQTRVAQGWDYYLKFSESYPTVEDLAEAHIDDVLKNWEGLGYYQRARNMHAAAQQIVSAFNGSFPEDFDSIRSLKGVGDYTASAIASFAFGLPHAVVDGNVIRILTRLFGISGIITSAPVKRSINARAYEVLDKDHPGKHNQAIMDFGAMQCTPAPRCENCPLTSDCTAFKNNVVDQIPQKKKSKPKRERFFYYIVFQQGDDLYIKKRGQKDVWEGLYEFYLIEQPEVTDWHHVVKDLPIPCDLQYETAHYKQTLSHQIIHARFALATTSGDKLLKEGYSAVNKKKMRNFAFPKIVDCYLRDKGVNLN